MNSLEKIKGLISYHKLKKGEHLTSLGKANSSEYFLLEGICKSYLFTPEGEDVTISFFMANSILSPHTTRVTKGKSMVYIRALTEVEVAIMDATAFENLMVEDLEIRQFGNVVLRMELMAKVQKEIALASMKGKERLQFLRNHFPNLENLVSHADIASYLGITTISLSRLRSNS